MAEAADLIITGARVYTVDPDRPWATALAVKDGRLLTVGADEEVADCRGAATKVRDAQGTFVMPGLVDVHNHHTQAGKADLYELTFSGAGSFDDVIAAVRAYASTVGENDWVIGSCWGTGLLGELSREESLKRIDEASAGRPVLLTDDSHHNRYVNSRALQLAGVTRDTPDPVGGTIIRDARTGNLTGVMLEAAGLLIEGAARESSRLTEAQYEAACARGVELAHGFGITAFQDAAISLEAMRALKSLDDGGDLSAWVISSMTVNDQIFGYADIGDALISRGEEFRSEHHRPDFIKIFLDGTPPAHSGAFLEPYLPTEEFGHDFCGHTTMPAGELQDWLMRTAAQGIGAKVHCTGDASVRMVLDAIEAVRNAGFSEPVYQIAHGQFIERSDVVRMATFNVVADICPFLWFPGVIADALGTVLKPELLANIQPNRTLIDAGVLVAGGSDWPVSETPNAWEGIHGLVTRADPSGQRPGTLAPHEAITVEEAIALFTINAATAMGLGEVTGSLTAGKSADFVFLDRNPLDIDPTTLVQTTVTETWFAGQRVFLRG